MKILEIKHLHMEFSSVCNARCPMCARNVAGYPINAGFKETNLSLSLVKKSFEKDFIKQLTNGIQVGGNFGDFVCNMESLPILEYFRSNNTYMPIEISTNGSARTKEFWQELAKLNLTIMFCLDGLEDTHKLYRMDTNWRQIISNASFYINAGGKAIWKMIEFEHNKHQIEACKKLANDLGFNKFMIPDHGRAKSLAFNRDGTFSHTIGEWDAVDKSPINEQKFLKNLNKCDPLPDQSDYPSIPKCDSLRRKSIYVSAEGKVYFCCFMGHSPKTYRTNFMTPSNLQLNKIIKENDLNYYNLETAIAWFNNVTESWQKEKYEDGRLLICDKSCGTHNPYKKRTYTNLKTV